MIYLHLIVRSYHHSGGYFKVTEKQMLMKRNIFIMALFTIALIHGRESITLSSAENFCKSLKLKTWHGTHSNDGPFCFGRGTPVTMADGSSKPIEKIIPGDRILSVNTAELSVEEDIVERADSAMHNNFVKIIFDDLTVNINTDDHPYYVKGKGWCSVNPELTFRKYKMHVGSLKPGDDCYKVLNGRIINVKISTIQLVPGRQPGFSIIKLKKNGSFFAGAKLVSVEEPEIKSKK